MGKALERMIGETVATRDKLMADEKWSKEKYYTSFGEWRMLKDKLDQTSKELYKMRMMQEAEMKGDS